MEYHNNIIYHFINNKKVNGTLFYCFEYFIFLNSFKSTDFLIYDISEKDLTYIKNIFLDRYVFDTNLLNKIKILHKRTDLIKLKYYKTLFLDIRSFITMYQFVNNQSNQILCFSNNTHENLRSNKNNIVYYGSYPQYQIYDKETLLKFNFDIFKKIDSTYSNTALVSSPKMSTNLAKEYFNIKEDNIIGKENNIGHSNMFENFDTLYYYHTGSDTNNRLIPECFWYNKDIVIQYNGFYEDSIYFRYNDIKSNGLEKYKLDVNDILIQDFLHIK